MHLSFETRLGHKLIIKLLQLFQVYRHDGSMSKRSHSNARKDNNVEDWIRYRLEDLDKFDGIYIPGGILSSAYSLDLSTCWTYIHASMNHSIHLRVTGCTRYKFRYVQLVHSGCKSSVSSCSGGRSMYCAHHKYLFSISPYAHTAQKLSTRKSHEY